MEVIQRDERELSFMSVADHPKYHWAVIFYSKNSNQYFQPGPRRFQLREDLIEWLDTNTVGETVYNNGHLFFTNEDDIIAFKLAWG